MTDWTSSVILQMADNISNDYRVAFFHNKFTNTKVQSPQSSDTMHGPSYLEKRTELRLKINEDTSFNQDTMHGPSYIEKCTELP